MGLFDKLKNIFIEEEEDEEIPVIKKEEVKVQQIKIEEEVLPKVEEVKKEEEIVDKGFVDTNQKFKFPVIFDDDDFKEEKKRSKSINVLERANNKYEPEIKKEIKPVKKVFKPSPVISPVYGVLNKNYSKDEISSKDGLLSDRDTVDIDYVIKKAYGNNEVTVSTREEKAKLIEEATEEENVIDLFENTPVTVPEEFNNDELFNKYISVSEIDDKIKSIDELLKDTSDDDFYSLVDSMYKDEEGDEV